MIVFDASTLILLARIDVLDLFLSSLGDKVVIPEHVGLEVTAAGKEESQTIRRHIEDKTITVSRVKNAAQVKKLMEDFNIDSGEAEALTLALEKKAKVVATDDRNAIRTCKILKLDFITAIAVLVRAVEKGALAKDEGIIKLRKLQTIGRYSKAIIEDAARQIQGG
jgi:predicted nucleic acid-binding protein